MNSFKMTLFTLKEKFSGICAAGINTADGFNQRRLVCSVFSAQRMNFPSFNSDIYLVQSSDTGNSFVSSCNSNITSCIASPQLLKHWPQGSPLY